MGGVEEPHEHCCMGLDTRSQYELSLRIDDIFVISRLSFEGADHLGWLDEVRGRFGYE